MRPLLFPLAAIALLVATADAFGAPPVYRCVTNGKVNYSDAPCVGGAVVDVTPTHGMDRMAGPSRKGADVQRIELNKALDEAIRPLTGKSHEEMNVNSQRFRLASQDQAACRQLDDRLPDIEAARRQATYPATQGRADADLYLARKRYFDLKC